MRNQLLQTSRTWLAAHQSDLALATLRLLVAIALLWMGVDKLNHPDSVSRLAARLGEVGPQANVTALLQLYGWLEVALAIALLVGLGTRYAAGGVAALALLALARTGFDSIIKSKDFGLAGGALAIVLLGAGAWSLDAWLTRRKSSGLPPGDSASKQRLALLLLRSGLAATFLWNGLDKLSGADDIARTLVNLGTIPPWPIVSTADPVALMLVLGWFEIALALMLLTGLFARVSAMVALLLMGLFMLRIGVFNGMMVKDVGLSGVALGITLIGGGLWSLDHLRQR